MSFFDFIGKMASNAQRKNEQKQREFDRSKQVTGSAIPPGRMKQTDTIKGKDCTLPQEPGMYRHRNKKTNEIDYIGQTTYENANKSMHVTEN